jgi:hypothetical protein
MGKFIYVFANRHSGTILLTEEGSFNKKLNLQDRGNLIHFYDAIEVFWTKNLMDKLESELQKNGHLTFCYLCDSDGFFPKKLLKEKIKLGKGHITFINEREPDFTYQSDDIRPFL